MFGSSVVPFLGVFYKKSWDKQLYNSVGRNTRFHQPISTIVPLLYPLKTPENLRFSGIFRGYRGRTLVKNGLLIGNVNKKRVKKNDSYAGRSYLKFNSLMT